MFQLRRLHWLLLTTVFFAGCSSNDVAVRKQAPVEKAPSQTTAPASEASKPQAPAAEQPATPAPAPTVTPEPKPEPKPAEAAKPEPKPEPKPAEVAKPAPTPVKPAPVAKPEPKPEPATAGPIVTTVMPKEIVDFLKADYAAVKSMDSDRVMKNYHKDFLSDGRDYGMQEGLFLAYGPQFAEKWEVKFNEIKIDGDTVTVLKGTGATTYGVANMAGTKLVKKNGRWLWLGNGK